MLQNCLLAGISHAVAAVNVRVLPNNKVGGKGEAVNVGYGSYVIAGEQPRFLSDATCNVTYPGQAPIEVPCDRGGVPAPPLIL